MKLKSQAIYFLFVRYLFLVLIAINNLWLFYAIFTPLTVYPVFSILSLFFSASLSGTVISFSNFSINLVEACIAGSAYYLLLVLNLSTPMPMKKRFFSFIFSFISLLVVNIIRILFFSFLFVSAFSLFNLTHLIFWYFLSAIIVFLIWFVTIKLFEIKEIPVYSDVKFLLKDIKKR